MREEELQRYGRQILLRELGGRGQRRLMEAKVEARGDSPAMESAVTYLRAGGTQVGEGGSVLLTTQPSSAPGAVVVVRGGVAWKSAAACTACWEKLLAALPSSAGPSVLVGSLAALAVQRLILGWAEPLGLLEWDGERLISRPAERCAVHSST